MRWMMICGLTGILLLLSSPAQADRPPWFVLVESVAYLRGLPEVAWIRAEDHRLMIGHLPKEDVYVFSLHAGQKDWQADNGSPPLCRTVAQNSVILESNC